MSTQTPEQIAAWAERQAGEDLPAKRPQGAAGHLSEEEKTAIRLAYLESGGGVTFKALAARFNVNRDTVSACMKGPEFVALQGQFQQEIRETALARLRAAVLPAADAWLDAIPIAAQKGDHRPARELLERTGTIQAEGSDRGITVIVGGSGDVNIGFLNPAPIAEFKRGTVVR